MAGRSDYYIPVFDELPTHRKVRELRLAMGWSGFEAVGFLAWFWLQVAADFPDGELPGLDRLKAMLRDVWKAAGIAHPKRERIHLIAKTLIDVGFVDRAPDAPTLLVHDWEDGAGRFAIERKKERDKKRRQREAARAKKGDDSVPGTEDDCPPDVPGEKEKGKRKKEKKPPYPPSKKGECSSVDSSALLGSDRDRYEMVLAMWREERDKAGMGYLEDRNTAQGADILAKSWLNGGKMTVNQLREGMRNIIGMTQTDPRCRNYDLRTLANNPSKYCSGPHIDKPKRRMIQWGFVCDVCGKSAYTSARPGDSPRPPPQPCHLTETCQGTMRVTEEIATDV